MVGRPFKKGQSGNPSGRPKVVAEVRDLARGKTGDAIKTLGEIMGNKKAPPAARVAAATAILDRGYGKPSQTVFTRRLNEMSEQEIIEFLGYEPGPDELRSLQSTEPAGRA